MPSALGQAVRIDLVSPGFSPNPFLPSVMYKVEGCSRCTFLYRRFSEMFVLCPMTTMAALAPYEFA